MATEIINLEQLHTDLKLSDEQKKLLSDVVTKIMDKYETHSTDTDYFSGVADGLNHAYKIINGISDDYNYTK